jgi:chitin disaccharide deacetylase
MNADVPSRRTGTRRLIVNADDFGQTPGINGGVMRAHRRGIVTSASLMVRWPAAWEAARYAAANPELSLGLHVDLGEWAFRSDTWIPIYEVVDTGSADEVQREIRDQVRRFRALTGRDPTHLDSHQHVHRDEPARSGLLQVAADLAVPLRHFTRGVRYRGDFYGQTGKGEPYPDAITPGALVELIRSLPEGTTELGCHPGDDRGLDSMYSVERAQEVDTLCHPSIRDALAEAAVEVCSFHAVAGDAEPTRPRGPRLREPST